MSGHSDDRGSEMSNLTQELPAPAGAGIRVPGRVIVESHEHPYPLDLVSWRDLAVCDLCGLTMLKLFITSSAWVARRVEHVNFIDDRTVRRRVSIDYVAPPDAVILCRTGGQQVRVLPLALMHRKSLVSFDLRDPDGGALPLLGLRQNQALTLAVVRAWAAATLEASKPSEVVSPEADDFLDDVIAGDQTELWRAFKRMWKAAPGSQLERLGTDQLFRAVLDRLADSFVLYGLHDGPAAERRLIKFSYDEPLTLRYTKPSYQPHSSGEVCKEKGENTKLPPWGRTPLSAAMGFSPTRVKFPVPAAELAASFHFEISAPPEVSIVTAALIAGRPKPEPRQPATASPLPATENGEESAKMKERERRRPSFDSIHGGYPTVDLHVADVPYGSRSRAQVDVGASVGGWFATAVFASWLASGVLLFAYMAKLELSAGSTLLMSFAAGLAALLVHRDPHRLVTRLLSKVRLLATLAALLALVAAAVMTASHNRDSAHVWLLALFIASLVPTVLVSASWLFALGRSVRDSPKESPWEHHRPRRSKLESEDPECSLQREDEARHETLSRKMDDSDYPYDLAHHKLGFDRPAIPVASCEGERQVYLWDMMFANAFHNRLDTHLEVVMARTQDLTRNESTALGVERAKGHSPTSPSA
jgi:hypothetical protein